MELDMLPSQTAYPAGDFFYLKNDPNDLKLIFDPINLIESLKLMHMHELHGYTIILQCNKQEMTLNDPRLTFEPKT